jgi:hypothetical protein
MVSHVVVFLLRNCNNISSKEKCHHPNKASKTGESRVGNGMDDVDDSHVP